MTDVCASAKNSYAATAINFDLHSGMRHFVPVNRQARTAQIRTASQPKTFAQRRSRSPLLESGSLRDFADALTQTVGGHCEVVHGFAVVRYQMPQA